MTVNCVLLIIITCGYGCKAVPTLPIINKSFVNTYRAVTSVAIKFSKHWTERKYYTCKLKWQPLFILCT